LARALASRNSGEKASSITFKPPVKAPKAGATQRVPLLIKHRRRNDPPRPDSGNQRAGSGPVSPSASGASRRLGSGLPRAAPPTSAVRSRDACLDLETHLPHHNPVLNVKFTFEITLPKHSEIRIAQFSSKNTEKSK
jgi:hypothetical protein